MNNNKQLIVNLSNITKFYKEANIKQNILHDVNLQLFSGDIVALVGASGSGKTTLLNIIGLLDQASSGELLINDISCTKLKEAKASVIRKDNIGFVFQFHHLLADFTCLENVMIPSLLTKCSKVEAKQRAARVLEQVGLKSKLNKFPSEISGGEKQRVAIARALVNSPKLLIADEPTGNLDPSLSSDICDLIIDLVKQNNGVAIIATHNLEMANKIGRIAKLNNGTLNYN
ncbi:ABC transporter ATP-binding protein [Rickettsiales bacterium LUAb2]